MYDEVFDVRQRLFSVHVRAEEQAIAELLAKGQFTAVYQRAEQLMRQSEADAHDLLDTGKLDGRLRQLREKAVRLHIASAEKTLKGLLDGKDLSGVSREGQRLAREIEPHARPLGLHEEMAAALAGIRKKALASRLDQAREETRMLLREDRYQAVGEMGEKTYKELGDEAKAVGLARELTDFRDSCRVFADLAWKAKIQDR
jgi:hypothetical protein